MEIQYENFKLGVKQSRYLVVIKLKYVQLYALHLYHASTQVKNEWNEYTRI